MAGYLWHYNELNFAHFNLDRISSEGISSVAPAWSLPGFTTATENIHQLPKPEIIYSCRYQATENTVGYSFNHWYIKVCMEHKERQQIGQILKHFSFYWITFLWRISTHCQGLKHGLMSWMTCHNVQIVGVIHVYAPSIDGYKFQFSNSRPLQTKMSVYIHFDNQNQVWYMHIYTQRSLLQLVLLE